MKFSKIFSIIACAAVVAVSCEKPNNGNNGGEGGGQQVTLNTEAKIEAAVFVSGEARCFAKVYDRDGVIEFAYVGEEEFNAFKNATAELTLSEGATVTPDPTVARDYTGNDVVFTVTSEDKNTTNEYRVELRKGESSIAINQAWSKTYFDLGLDEHMFAGQSGIAFSGTNIVTFDCQVFDLEGNKVGTLNTEGVIGAALENFQLVCLSNTIDGVLVATVGIGADDAPATSFDGVAASGAYAWLGGWDKAPTCIKDNFTEKYPLAGYMTVGGYSDGNCVLISKYGGQNNFSYWPSTTGLTGVAWSTNMNSSYEANDGNWGQWISPLEGTADGKFVIGDSNGNNQGYYVFVRQGKNGAQSADVALRGTLATDGDGDSDHQGTYEYGNYSIGHVRAFSVFGKDFVSVASSGWPAAYLTVQTLDPNDEDHYLLRSQAFATAAPSPSSEFYFDPQTGRGYLAFISQNYLVALYEIYQERL